MARRDTNKKLTVSYGGMKCEGPMHCSGEITSDKVSAVTAMTSAVFVATQDIESPTVTATEKITTPTLTLGETPVLTPTALEKDQYIAVTYGERDEETLTAKVYTKECSINADQHLLTCQTALGSLTKPIKQMIIPTGLDFTGKSNTDSSYATVAEINGTDMLLGMARIYVENSQLMVKIVFSETPEYTSIKIKINMVYI